MGQCATKPDSSNTPTTGKLSRSRSLTLTSLPSLSHEEPANSVMEEHQSNDEYSDDFDEEEERLGPRNFRSYMLVDEAMWLGNAPLLQP